MDAPVEAAVAPSALGNGTKITKTDLKTTDSPLRRLERQWEILFFSLV
jgi:hypothetical protein